MPDVVTIPADPGAIPAQLHAAAEPKGAIVFVPAIFGLDPGTLQICDALAAGGLTTLVYDPFHRSDPGVCGFDEAGFARGIARAKAFDHDQGLKDMSAICKWMKQRTELNGLSLGAVGVCFGGHFPMVAAASGWIDAGFSFHGGGIGRALDKAHTVNVPLRMHFGTADKGIPAETVDTIEEHFDGQRKVKVIRHEGLDHGFFHLGSPRVDVGGHAKGMKDIWTTMGIAPPKVAPKVGPQPE